MKTLLLFICFIFLCSSPSRAQDVVSDVEQTIDDIFEQYSAESDQAIDYDTFYDDLIACSKNPVNVNKTNREELKRLPFLSDIQIENILSYVYQYGPLYSIYELQLIEGLDMTDIRRMIPFVVVGEAAEPDRKIYWNDLLKYGKNEMYFRLDKGLETKEGYQPVPEDDANPAPSTTGKYLGNDLYHSIRYSYNYKDRILAGFTGEKDAGEQFWGSVHKGYDFYSFHAQINNVGKFKTIVLGDYRADFGQGLVLHPEFSMGKSSFVLNVSQRNSGLTKYSSCDENNFFRGGGTTLHIDKFDITAFYSNKMIDGDTVNGTFSSIIKTGYHRTLAELSKKHTVSQQIIGGNVTYTNMNLQVGVTGVHTILDTKLVPDKSVYNYFYFSGYKQTTGGVFYRFRLVKLNLFGETAMTDKGSIATLNGCFFNPAPQVSLVVLHRYYAPEYDTFYATAFSESSGVNDENGLYIGAELRPMRYWKFAGYIDSYRFPWPKYAIDAPSVGKDYFLQADFAARRNSTMYWRLKYEEKQTNLSTTGSVMPVIVPIQKMSMRYNLSYFVGKFTFRNLIDGNLVRQGENPWTYGIMASQDLSYGFKSIPVKIAFRYQLFDAVNYGNRFYSYEKDVLYAFSSPMYYGLGTRYYMNLQYDFSRHLSLWFKIAQTVYADDRETLSSGNETVSGNRKTDVRLLIRWKF